MTQEDKELLLKDLSARLLYGVKCTTKSMWDGIYTIEGCRDNRFFLDCPVYDEGDDEWMIESIVPYLRPMSSMTEEEYKELKQIALVDNEGVPGDITAYIDWLNKNMFDYRGLIHMNLALEAPNGMYK